MGLRLANNLVIAALCMTLGIPLANGQATQPIVAIHDSELTRALETINASNATPTGPGTTGKEWWPTDWHYFVMPESLKEAFRSDGTPFAVVGDSNITAGILLTNGSPRYPILFSLTSEAMRDDEIAPLTNYVAAGGFLFVGGSAFSRFTNGITRGDFAFASQLGLHALNNTLVNWTNNNNVTKQIDNRLTAHLPSGALTWRLPSASEEIPWGQSPSHQFLAPHDIWQVQVADATVLAVGDSLPFLTIKQYGKGYFIYCSAFQPLIGFSGFAPTTYAYLIFRRAIEWAFQTVSFPVAKLSPWPYQYDAAFMIRHDLENFTNSITNLEASAQIEASNGVKGDYYFCTGTLRDDAAPGGYNVSSIVASLRRAVTNYGATIGPHNGGLKNPTNLALVRGQYDYWHWGPDEALDVVSPPSGYPNGKAYALASISNSFKDVEGWLSGTTNGAGLRPWCACYFNGTREDSYDIQQTLNVRITGDQKLTPFPHWTVSTKTPGKRYALLSEPVSDWFVNGLVAQSLEPWHSPGIQTSQTMHDGVDFYFNNGFLVNFYSHTMSTGLGDAGNLVPDYINYCVNTNLHPRLWLANAISVYNWWLARSNAQISVSMVTNGAQAVATFSISGSTQTNTAVELLAPGTNGVCSVQVIANGQVAAPNTYRTNGQIIRVLVGTSVTNLVVSYYPYAPTALVFSDNFDSVSAPALPSGWTTTASAGQATWITQTATRDTAPNAAFCTNLPTAGTSDLISPPIALPAGQATLSFMNNYDLESGSTNAYDGGVLEIKVGTNVFADILAAGGTFVSGGYNLNISTLYGNPLGGRAAWSGTSTGFISTVVSLPPAASGQTNQLRWRLASDSGNNRTGWRVDTVSISSRTCLCCGGTNTAPVLPAQSNRTINELTPLVVTNTATDAQGNPMVYALSNPPSGASIDASGIITWTPDETQGPGVYTLTTIVTDFGSPPLSASNSFNVTVNEVNTAPTLPFQPDRTINEGATLAVTNTATDTDFPPNPLTYTLVNPPVGASISQNGIITWTTDETTGPSTNVITTVATDTNTNAVNSQHLSATNSFTVVVNEINTAPVLPFQPNRTIAGQTTLIVTNTATDSDIPANTLTYSLLTGPTNAAIDANGVITWTPVAAQDPSTNVFTTVVTDFNPWAVNSQHLSATNGFTVILNSHPLLAFDSSALVAEGCMPTNNAVDPGETVTMLFGFRDVGLINTTNLTVSLLATNGVLAPSAPQNYGVLVGGGSATSQPFTFTASGSCGTTITPTFLLQDNDYSLGVISTSLTLGTTGAIFNQDFDGVAAPAIPAGWAANSSINIFWITSTNLPDGSLPNNAFGPDTNIVSTVDLVSPVFSLPSGQSQLSFRHRYAFECDVSPPTDGYDGGVVEIKIGTNAFADVITAGGSFVTSNGYNAKINALYQNPLANRNAWSGTNNNYSNVVINLPLSAAGQNVQLRWRIGTDNGNGGGGWHIDSIAVQGLLCCTRIPPVLAVQTNRTINEGTTLTVNNAASDPSAPPGSLTYSLVNPPANASIDTNGVIAFMPDESQGPGTNTITTLVSDSGLPPLTASNSFTVVVNEVNSPPVLQALPDVTIVGTASLTVTNTATDPDLPANPLAYTLTGPAGAAIDANGIITWTPLASQVPSTNIFTTVVTDSNPWAVNSQHLSATNMFTVVVQAIHNGPSLMPQPDVTITELTMLAVTNVAVDNDIPPLPLTYQLLSPPLGMNITNGLITWTPNEAQGPSTNLIITVVSDGQLSVTNSFTVIVNESNSPPALPVQTDLAIVGTASLTVTNTATDPDLPANTLTYTLIGPTNAAIDTNGIITWTPLVSQVPSTNVFTTIVTDYNPWAVNSQHLSATNTFSVVVQAIHNGPSLPPQPDQTIVELTTLVVTNSAVDNDVPPLPLTYELLNPPAGMTITNGVITWTPDESQGPGTNVITTVVSDGQFSATNSFTVFVNESNSPPSLPLQSNRTIIGLASLVVTNTATDPDLPANSLAYALTGPTNAAIDANGVITWTPVFAQVPSTNVFTTVVTDFNPWAINSQHLSATNTFTVVDQAIHNGPSLPPQTNRIVGSGTTLIVTNTAIDTDIPLNPLAYQLTTAPSGAAIDTNGVITWTPSITPDVVATNLFVTVVRDICQSPRRATNSFAVIVSLPPPPPVIQSIGLNAGAATIIWSSAAGHSYQLQYVDNIADTNWKVLLPTIQATGDTSSMTNDVSSSTQRFYRVVLLP